jgi:hypothetical protein
MRGGGYQDTQERLLEPITVKPANAVWLISSPFTSTDVILKSVLTSQLSFMNLLNSKFYLPLDMSTQMTYGYKITILIQIYFPTKSVFSQQIILPPA